MDQEKIDFLKNDFIFLLKHLAPDAAGQWGRMNGQQMVEHFVDVVKIANGRLTLPMINADKKLEKARAFVPSDKPFPQNLRNPLLDETPAPAKKSTMQAAIEELQQELKYFFDVFEQQPAHTTSNPFFGDLTFEHNVQLLHKHAVHHLRQFGLVKG